MVIILQYIYIKYDIPEAKPLSQAFLLQSSLQCYTFLAYIVGMAPPGNIFNLVGAGETMLNILKVCYCNVPQ